MRQLIRRFWACETGAGLMEYGLIIAILALGLLGGLRFYRDAVGGLTNRTAVTISRQSARGYAGGAVSGGTSPAATPQPAIPPAPEPEPRADNDDDDDDGAEPGDSTAVAGGALRSGY